jgi:PAS domain S-box-containing protein
LLRELTSILESSSAGIAFLRGNTLARCNARFERMLGFAAGAVAGSSVRELFASQPNAEQIVDDIESALAEAGVFETEIEIRLPGKPVQWAALSARRVGSGPAGSSDAGQAAAGQPEVVAVLTDITRLKRQHGELERLAGERERTEAAMGQQAELTRAILDSVFVGIVTVGPRGIEWMNRSARRMFGGGLAALRHEPLSCVATAEGNHPFRRAETMLSQSGHAPELPAVGFECRVEALDGRSFWVVGNVVASGDDESPQLTYALLDIDRRREAEARSAQAQASLQRVIELAPLAIALFDAGSGKVRHLNPVAAALAGVSAEDMRALAEPLPSAHAELLGPGESPAALAAADLSPPLGGDALQDDLQAALLRGDPDQPVCREVRVERGGQTQVWDARYLPLAEPGQAADQVLMVATDVTAQRAAEAARLEAAIAQREMLVKEVHHRIKNNLQGVAGLLTQIAQRRPEVASVLRDAVAQVQAIAQVYGLQVAGRGPLRLASLLEAIAASLSRSSGRPIAVALHGSADGAGLLQGARHWALPEAEAIPVALTLNELLGNALKHGGPGAVECTLVSDDAEVRIEIRNEGRLPAGFSLEQVGAGVLGLGLVRALLPRRSATLSLTQEGARVLARVSLRSPGLTRLGSEAG